jgi:hypothetical protein
MRDDEICRFGGILRAGFGRPLDCDPVATEDEQVEIELTRSPALAIAAPERPLELLQGHEEGERPDRRIGTARDIEGDNGIAELGLVHDADGVGRVEPGDASKLDARHGRQGGNTRGDRRRRIAEVGPEPDVRPNASRQCRPPAQ